MVLQIDMSLRSNCEKSEYEFNHIPQRYKRKDLLL
jgi:hypothetical protein